MAAFSRTARQPFALSAEDHQLLPTATDIEFYRRHGWFLAPPLLTEEEVDELAEAAEQHWAGHRDRVLPVQPPNLTYWEPGQGLDVFRNNDYILHESAAVARVLSKPVIGAVAALLAGTDQIRVLNSTLWYKPPSIDGRDGTVPWHTDRHYWMNHSSEELLTAFVPFHDCDESMGTLRFADGSHRWAAVAQGDDRHFAERDPRQQHAAMQRHAAASSAQVHEIPVTYRKGQMSFHHCRIWHGSGPNTSHTPRRTLGLHLQDRGNHWREYRDPDGRALSYNHDVLVRKTPEGVPDYADPDFCPVLWDGSIQPRTEVTNPGV